MAITGRGGYGNYIRSSSSSTSSSENLNSTYESPELAAAAAKSPELAACLRVPSSSPAPIQHYTSPNQKIRIGRGGSGNKTNVSSLHVMSPKEYLNEARQAYQNNPSVYVIGRGGNGNIFFKRQQQQQQNEFNNEDYNNNLKPSSSNKSNVSNESNNVWNRLKSTLSGQ